MFYLIWKNNFDNSTREKKKKWRLESAGEYKKHEVNNDNSDMTYVEFWPRSLYFNFPPPNETFGDYKRNFTIF